ncbi:MAG: ABC transporter permease [Firmicutes bacterium]|jgi:peptide/nickel transport system permease protein|nr:ABC transporter permease [Bacillota bacterium]
MLTYIARRLLFLPVVLIGVTLLVFVAMSFLSPYQLVSAYIKSPEELKNQNLDALVRKYGLNDPIHIRYFRWLGNLLRGDLGYSQSANMFVLQAIKARFPATLELALFSFIPVVLGGIWLGTISAMHHNRFLDHATRIFAIIGWSLPSFVGGLIMLMYFYGVLGWFPPGRLSTWAYQIVLSPEFRQYTGMHTVDAILNWNWRVFWDAVRHLIAPTITLAYLWWAFILRITRSSMLDVLNKDYVRTARAKGLRERLVISRHVRRNAMIPVATVAGLMVLGLLGGMAITETVFDFKGIGLLTTTAAQQLDYTMVLGSTLFYGVLLVAANLIVDVMYAIIDPRVRLE